METEQIWRELVESSVECGVCNEPYDDSTEYHVPRLLSCGHTFCHQCMEEWSGSCTRVGNTDEGSLLSMDCPTCRRPTIFNEAEGISSLPRNFELLRVRLEIESQTQHHLEKFTHAWQQQLIQKETLAREAEENAMIAQQESIEASERARMLMKQVEINEQEKRAAQKLAEEARERALYASQHADILQQETDQLKKRLQQEAQQLQRVQTDASTAAAEAAVLQSRAQELQQQVESVRAQLSLHSGRCDPSKLVVLVVEPTTVGSWILPYTRYAVISIASTTLSTKQGQLSYFNAAKLYTVYHQIGNSSTASVKVYRRYSDFLWLYQALCRTYPLEFIPILPKKQVFKSKEFIGERMRSLQAFIRQLLQHSVLGTSEEVRLFLLSTTEELEQIRCLHGSMDDEEQEGLEPNTGSSSSTSSISSSTSDLTVGTTSSWAWGAMSAIKSSAAKLVTTTGTALTNVATTATTSASVNSDDSNSIDIPLSDSLTGLLEDQPVEKQQAIVRRRKCIEIAQAHDHVTMKGVVLSRAQRQYAHHLHRICEYVHELDKWDKIRGKTKVLNRMEQSTYTAQQVEDDARLCLETRSFQAKASEAMSALSLGMTQDAECMEYALLEISRMQILGLGAIEDAFTRIRHSEQILRQVDGETSSVLIMKQQECSHKRLELMKKIVSMEPQRSHLILQTLQQNSEEMKRMISTRRKMLEGLYKQLQQT